MPPKDKAEAQSFSFETMACVLAVMDAKGATLGTKAYELMATLDGNRSSSAFQHQFRAVKHRGKELASQLGSDTATPTPKTPKTPKTAKKPTTASAKKRNSMFDVLARLRCGQITNPHFHSADKTANEGDDDDEDKVTSETPSKRTRIKKEKEASVDAPDGDVRGMYTSFFDDAMPEEE
jgi:hypothetical protein